MKKLIRKDNPNVVIDALWVKEDIVGNNKFYDISLRDMKILPGEAHISVSQDEWIVVDVDEDPVDLEKEAVAFCFDNGINVTPHQATRFARYFYKLGQIAQIEQNKALAAQVVKLSKEKGCSK